MDNKNLLCDLLEMKYQDFIYKKIFKILDTEDYTSNSNGIFIKLNDIQDEKIVDCIKLIKSVNTSSINYMMSENIREKNIQEMQNQVKKNKVPVKNIVDKIKEKPRVLAPPKKKLKIPEIYKRIQKNIGKRQYCRKPEVFKGDSEDERTFISDTEEVEEVDEVDEVDEEEVEEEVEEVEEDIDFKELGLEWSSDEEPKDCEDCED